MDAWFSCVFVTLYRFSLVGRFNGQLVHGLGHSVAISVAGKLYFIYDLCIRFIIKC